MYTKLIFVPVFNTGKHIPSERRRCVKRPWSETKAKAVMKHMKPYILNGLLVMSAQCALCKEKEHSALEGRTIQNIRDFVRNNGLKKK